ncbi:SUMF1/EgtB/PvdO family nonheme iron enzyme [Lacinutrix sp. WUR7]|uniref:formylglycine-generating enzyme family protein n=1 Tax=Lacinutrix sp. WUR7 TaxID=2653681 RepID=UPI00193CDF12|nr:SUMF1/EgtB/PvdO family nonheme iron enzyme [Lacinutrix sp. WUR7]QRM89243.1 SUMF1/EgtB/PvdO family nonheme iron enzyme [Lacinutrix sp. WUR7]
MRNLTKTLLLLLFVTTIQGQELPEMIKITGGTFTMGAGHNGMNPTPQITLSDFNMGKTEVTIAQYRYYCKSTGIDMPERPDGINWNDNYPVVKVSWYDAVNYCKWLTEQTGNTYSLPTEAQWEFAARGGTKSKGYNFSGSFNLNTVGWYKENSESNTNIVATKEANELGLYDMSGNVGEWCLDWHDRDFYSKSPEVNPENTTEAKYRIFRGGHFISSKERSITRFRSFGKPESEYDRVGFRVVSY